MNLTNLIQKNIIIRLQQSESTKLELANLSNVSITAITSHITELKNKGYIIEVDSNLYTGGRIPKVLKINSNKYTLGISISKSLIRVSLLNIMKEIIEEVRHEEHFETFNEYIYKSKEICNDLLERKNIDIKDVISKGLALPGPINNKTNIIERVSFSYNAIQISDIKEILYDDIIVQNDANLALLSEMKDRNLKETTAVYLAMNDGFGAGIFNEVDFIKSNVGYAGEIGHMIIDYKNNITFGEIVSTEKIVKAYNTNSNEDINNIKQFFKKVVESDDVACSILDEVIITISAAINNILMLLDPSYLIIGGQLAREFNNITKLQTKYKLEDIESVKTSSEIIFSTTKNSTTRGAAIFALDTLFGQLKIRYLITRYLIFLF